MLSKPFYAIWLLMFLSGNVYAEVELDETLKKAINEGDLAKVESLLPIKTVPGAGFGNQLLFLETAMEINIDMFKMLMEGGINVYLDEDPEEIDAWLEDVNKNLTIFNFLVNTIPSEVALSNHYHYVILEQAIYEGHIEAVKQILDFQFDVNIQDGEGITPLIEIVKLLLDNGSDVNHKSIYETALMEAVSQGYKDIVKLLLDNKADVNAQESLSKEEGKILIATDRDSQNIKIIIQDTGCGIPPENLSAIFDPFFTTKSAIKRTGLGLLLSLGIVKGHKGDIDVKSKPGSGTTFTITLPIDAGKKQ